MSISFKYELNIQNVKHKNEKCYKLANDYVSQIKFDFLHLTMNNNYN